MLLSSNGDGLSFSLVQCFVQKGDGAPTLTEELCGLT